MTFNKQMFQHRQYAAIAALLADLDETHTPETIKGAFATLFKRDNDRFDWDRFMNAAAGKPSNWRDRSDTHRHYQGN